MDLEAEHFVQYLERYWCNIVTSEYEDLEKGLLANIACMKGDDEFCAAINTWTEKGVERIALISAALASHVKNKHHLKRFSDKMRKSLGQPRQVECSARPTCQATFGRPASRSSPGRQVHNNRAPSPEPVNVLDLQPLAVFHPQPISPRPTANHDSASIARCHLAPLVLLCLIRGHLLRLPPSLRRFSGVCVQSHASQLRFRTRPVAFL